MSEAELLANGEFLKWCAHWEADRRAPHAMADWALENVGELAFEACVWAHEKEERADFLSGDLSRVFPSRETGENSYKGQFYWMPVAPGCKQSDYVPFAENNLSHRPTFPAAIAYYLTHFDREVAAKYPPNREAVPV